MNSDNTGYKKGYVVLISLVAAVGGFLFGYDTAVVSGAIGFLKIHFKLTADLTGWAASSMLVGCMFGAIISGPLGDRLGRKWSLSFCGLLFALSSLASALPQSLSQFAWARFAGGVAIGAASILSPIYIAEVSPEKSRGRLVALYQLAIVIGILIVFFVNYKIQQIGDLNWNVTTGWRWMFGSLVAPSVLFFILMMLMPESPRWLMKAGYKAEALVVLTKVGGNENAKRQIEQISKSLNEEQGKWKELLSGGYFRALVVGALLAIFSQFSGINAIMYYGPEVFKAAGVAQDNAFLQTVIVGAINLVFTFVAIGLVDNSGRKPLLLFGTAAQTIAHLLIGYLFLKNTGGLALLIAVLSFVAAFAMAMGPVSWIVNSEIFPNKLRGRAMSVSIFLLWFADWVVTQTFPMLQESIGPAKTFWVYGICSFLSFVFILFYIPETKGKTLEEIEAFWRKNKK